MQGHLPLEEGVPHCPVGAQMQGDAAVLCAGGGKMTDHDAGVVVSAIHTQLDAWVQKLWAVLLCCWSRVPIWYQFSVTILVTQSGESCMCAYRLCRIT